MRKEPKVMPLSKREKLQQELDEYLTRVAENTKLMTQEQWDAINANVVELLRKQELERKHNET